MVGVGATGTMLLSQDQIAVTTPIPFRRNGILLLLLGAGLWSLRRRAPVL